MKAVSSEEQATALIDRLLESAAGFFTVYGVYIGHKLGFYAALADGPLTSVQLAAATRTQERYAREWLEQQAVTGMLDVASASDDAQKRTFALPPGHAEVLLNEDSLNYLAPLLRLLVGAASPLPRVLEAYRSGGGVPYADYGPDLIEGQAGINRAMLLQLLGSEWLPAVPEVHARLQASPPARVADFGCGAGWAAIGIARAYPDALADGFDLDPVSIDLANQNAREHGVADRVKFEVRDAGDPALRGQYDLVIAVECIHDMSDPVAALRVMRRLAGENGTVIVVDERVADEFSPPGSELEWMMYGWSMLHCLPVGMADQPSVGTGTVLRAPLLGGYAKEAGFSRTEVLPIEADFFRFYRLHA